MKNNNDPNDLDSLQNLIGISTGKVSETDEVLDQEHFHLNQTNYVGKESQTNCKLQSPAFSHKNNEPVGISIKKLHESNDGLFHVKQVPI